MCSHQRCASWPQGLNFFGLVVVMAPVVDRLEYHPFLFKVSIDDRDSPHYLEMCHFP